MIQNSIPLLDQYLLLRNASLVKRHLEGDIAQIPDGAEDIPLKSLTVNIDTVQTGSGDPSPDNIRPFTGVTQSRVCRSGYNMIDQTRILAVPNAGIAVESEQIFEGATVYYAGISDIYNKFKNSSYPIIGIKPNRQYSAMLLFKALNPDNNTKSGIKINIGYTGGSDSTGPTASHGRYVRIVISNPENTTMTTLRFPYNSNYWISLVGLALCLLDSGYPTDVDHPIGNTLLAQTVDWQSVAGSIYGGKLDPIRGTLTVTKGFIESYAGEDVGTDWLSSMDVYNAETTLTPTTGAQVVYTLETPQIYRVDPIKVATLEGYNNVWSDTGDVAVDYYADATLTIKALEERIQALENA